MSNLQRLREIMLDRKIDMYLIPTSDFHQTESVGRYFKCREYISGFTGSEGTLIVGKNEAALWVDGRYYLQAEKELEGSEIVKMESGEEGVLDVFEYINANLPEGGKVGFDGRVVNTSMAETILQITKKKSGQISCDRDLVNEVWEDRPPLPKNAAWFLEYKYSGENVKDKIERVKKYLVDNNLDAYIISTLDDIAWLTNMRGSDVEFFPVALSYIVFYKGKANLFIDKNKLNESLIEEFSNNDFEIFDYEDIYIFIEKLTDVKRVGINKNTLNYKVASHINSSIEVVDEVSPTVKWKACKNKIEIENTKKAHLKDAIAMTKFIYWIKKEIENESISEWDACKKLEEFREEQENFIGLSFETIGAFGSNGAIVHYHPQSEKSKILKLDNLFLIDSGGHYKHGTTDVTRTIVLGNIGKEVKKNFTLVLKGMIKLSKAKFLYGCNGKNLDILCRGVLWDLGLDYKHGTGHGVGHILSVHEDPVGIRWRQVEGVNDMEIFEEGMITSNEPGLYFEGQYGIRIENELMVKKAKKNSNGQFMEFDTLTLVPIDIDGLLPEELDSGDREWLNKYHKKVYSQVSPYLDREEKEWLEMVTRAI